MWLRKHALLAQFMVVFAFLCFTAPCFAADPFAGRILPTKKVSFFTDGKKVGQYTAEAPLPWNTLVKCDGRAAVRMEHMIVVFENGSSFVLSRTGNGDTLDLKTGTAYFTLKTLPEGLTFGTPQAPVVTEMMVLNAATGDQLLKGYVKAGKSESELGVLEGGSLMVRTADGQQTIKSGQRIILAQRTLGDGAAGGAIGGEGLSGAALAGLIVGGAAVMTGVAIWAAPKSDSVSDGEASPFTPPN
jgi:hypothetical protein